MVRLSFNLPATVLLAFASTFLVPGSAILSTATGDQRHRKLDGFVIPFQIIWRFEISKEKPGVPEDRQPTDEEYDGINQATMDWFTVEVPFAYAEETNFTFRDISCATIDTLYSPQAADWQHQIAHDCDATFDADSEDSIPTVAEFLLQMNQKYLLDNFVKNHLRSAEPSSPPSIFRYALEVGYTTTNAGAGAIDLTPSPTTTPPASTTPTPAPDTSFEPAPTNVTSDPIIMTGAPSSLTLAPTTVTSAPTSVASAPITMAPAPTMATDPSLPQQKEAPPAKCGSLALDSGRGGAAAAAKGCTSRTGKKRKLKGSK